MHVTPLSYKIAACRIFVKNFSAKYKKIFEFGLVQHATSVDKVIIINAILCQRYELKGKETRLIIMIVLN